MRARDQEPGRRQTLWRRLPYILAAGIAVLVARKTTRENNDSTSQVPSFLSPALTNEQLDAMIEEDNTYPQTVKRIYDILETVAKDENPHSRNRMFLVGSGNFKIKGVEGFPEVANNPGALSHFSASTNTLRVKFPHLLKCDDFAHTIRCGLVSSHTTLWQRTYSKSNIPSHKLDYPFTTEAQQNELLTAINKDTQFIITEFAKWHDQARSGTLSSTQQQEYDTLISALKEYQPRCRMFFVRLPLDAVRKQVDAQGGSILQNGYRLYATGLEEYQGGTIVHGRFVADPANEKEKADGFIADILYDSYEVIRRIHSEASGRPEDSRILGQQIVATLYNNINANPPLVFTTFFSHVGRYNQAFFSPPEEREVQQAARFS